MPVASRLCFLSRVLAEKPTQKPEENFSTWHLERLTPTAFLFLSPLATSYLVDSYYKERKQLQDQELCHGQSTVI